MTQKIKVKKIYLYLISTIITLPVFFYYTDGIISLGECGERSGRCPAVPIGIFFLLILSSYFIIQNTYVLLVTIFIFLFGLEYLFYNDLKLILTVFKILAPYIIFLGFYSYMQNKKRTVDYKDIEFFVCKAVPYTIILFQIIILLSNLDILISRSEGIWPSFIFDSVKVYNYNQFFSYILFLGCAVRIFNSSSFMEKALVIILLLFSCYHATNTTALLCSILFILIYFTYNFSNNFANFANKNSNFIPICFLLLFFIIPLFSYFFLDLIAENGVDKSLEFKGINTRFYRYEDYLSNLNLSNLFSGIYPNPFETLQPHNQLIEYFIFFGFLKSFILCGILGYIILNIKNFSYSIPLCIILGCGGGLSEIISHLYTGPFFFIYGYLCTFVKKKKYKYN